MSVAEDDDADSTLSADSRANSFSSDSTADTPGAVDDEMLSGMATMSLKRGDSMDESQEQASRDEESRDDDDEVMVVGDTEGPARCSLADLPVDELHRRLEATSKQLHSARMRQLKRHFKLNACKKRLEGLLSGPPRGPKVTFVEDSPVRPPPFQYAMDTDETQIDEPGTSDTEALGTPTDPEEVGTTDPEAVGAITDPEKVGTTDPEAIGTTDPKAAATDLSATPTPNGTPGGSTTSGGETDTHEVASCVANLFPDVPDGYVTRRDQLAMRPSTKGKGKGKKKGKGACAREDTKPAKLSRAKSSKKLDKLKRMNAKSNHALDDDAGSELTAGALGSDGEMKVSEPSSSSRPKPKSAPKRKALRPAEEPVIAKSAPKRKALRPAEEPVKAKSAPKRKALPSVEEPVKAKSAPKRKALPSIEEPVKAKSAPKRRALPPAAEIEEPSVTAPKGKGRGGKLERFVCGFEPEAFRSNLQLVPPLDSVETATQKLHEIMCECKFGRAGGHAPNTAPQFAREAPVRLSVYWKKPAVGVKVAREQGGVSKMPQLHFVSWKSPCICTQVYAASQIGNAEWWYTVQKDNRRDQKVDEVRNMLMEAHTSAVRTFTGEDDY
ncbi:unnamed protein product [Symbiodinium microadriaticum]|nr:unnamed protein product [Symbiodinium sp. KB8]CAE7841040.1 unnamed protein product [Symbiodinium microadriaticum]